MSDDNLQLILQKFDQFQAEIKAELNELKTDQARIEAAVEKSNERTAKFDEKFSYYQQASDRVANLAFTVVTASAAVIILSPAVKAISEFYTR